MDALLRPTASAPSASSTVAESTTTLRTSAATSASLAFLAAKDTCVLVKPRLEKDASLAPKSAVVPVLFTNAVCVVLLQSAPLQRASVVARRARA